MKIGQDFLDTQFKQLKNVKYIPVCFLLCESSLDWVKNPFPQVLQNNL